MSILTKESTCPVSPDRVYAWHTRPGAFGRLAPPWQRLSVVDGLTEIRDGSRVTFDLVKGPLRFRWVVEHCDVRPGRGFSDVQVEGPFESWVHRRDFEPQGEESCLLRDEVDYLLPGGAVGKLLAHKRIAKDLERVFDYRHRVLAGDLELHAAYFERPRLRVAVTGASGLVGSALCDLLTTGGHEVVPLVRSGDDGVRWTPERGLLDPRALGRVDAVVHLAGENIAARRWSREQKERIRHSRVEGTRNLVRSLALLDEAPAFVAASAIGFYGDRGDTRLTEDDPAGDGFLASVCDEWEHAALEASALGMRVALARFGVVLSPHGGALAKMLPPFRAGVGGRVGRGRQMMSWVSIDDAIGAIHHLLMEPAAEGPFNVTAPRPVSNTDFTRTLGSVLRRPTILPMPAPMARMAFGEMADEMLLASTRAHPMRLESAGYAFRHPNLDDALRYLLGRS